MVSEGQDLAGPDNNAVAQPRRAFGGRPRRMLPLTPARSHSDTRNRRHRNDLGIRLPAGMTLGSPSL